MAITEPPRKINDAGINILIDIERNRKEPRIGLEYLVKYERAVSQMITISMTNNQYSALVCVCYIMGVKGLSSNSRLVNCLNSKKFVEASRELALISLPYIDACQALFDKDKPQN